MFVFRVKKTYPGGRLLGVFLLLVLPLARGGDPPDGTVILTEGFSQSAYRNVNKTDAEAAFRVFTKTAARDHGYEVEVRTVVFEDPSLYMKAIQRDELSIAIIDTWDYLAMDLQGHAEAYYVPEEKGRVLEEYLLLTRRDSQFPSLGELRGKDLILLESTNAKLGGRWIDTLIFELSGESRDAFFHHVGAVRKVSAAVLPVFFGQREACVVDRSAFEIMAELNPQVGRQLRAIAVSEPYLDTLICLGEMGWPSKQAKGDMIRGLGDMHNQPAGRQILNLFKVDRLVPFQARFTESVRRLRVRYQQRSAAIGRRHGVGSGTATGSASIREGTVSMGRVRRGGAQGAGDGVRLIPAPVAAASPR